MQLQGNNDHNLFFELEAAPHFYGFAFYLGR